MFFLFLFILIPSYFSSHQAEAKGKPVYIVPIENTVEDGLYAFLSRALDKAEKDHASLVIFEINTPGGLVDSAGKIAKILGNTPLKTVAYVNNRALSAGAYIALNADQIYMVPSGVMGAAAVIDSSGNTAEKKAQSYWLAAMKTAAEQNGRNPLYAQAMADENVDLPEYGAEKGKLLTFTSAQAEKAGYSEGTVSGKNELYEKLDITAADVRPIDENIGDKLARFITNPVVVPILLTIALLGIVIELFTPGFGIPGIIGTISIVLFFYGHLVAGMAGYESIGLFAAGVVLVLLELFVPGGIIGAFGLAAIVGSLFLAAESAVEMAISLLIALAVSVIAAILFVKVFGKEMKFFKKIILTDSTNTEQGYISSPDRSDLLGQTGMTLTDLRPAGTVLIGEERVDVVTEGGFISKNSAVRVVKTEGSRIVVREIKNKQS
ncbi:nodulation protein NfeD [Bacillus sp. MUM 13]|uniref:NfeD family protein n=1 Tax=Bacillus sp. MUM 13 TaxID=1678001 RepID=UPI000B014B07|nr:nodulation protein NfeD [Bacillus sp. MUM 13]